uniref:Uncharacterized protein n=1 Tax=Anguilla anguilla TaxID=7936 RepID=A0A0E9RJL5_ANGAN
MDFLCTRPSHRQHWPEPGIKYAAFKQEVRDRPYGSHEVGQRQCQEHLFRITSVTVCKWHVEMRANILGHFRCLKLL